jgi:putative copper export protein
VILVLAALQWLHVLCAVLWFGSILFSNLVLFPELRRLRPDQESAVLHRLRSGRGRRITLAMASGTVGLGIIRGITGGVLSSLDTPYGMTFLAAAVIGLAMVLYLFAQPRQRLVGWAYLAGFPLIFTLMIAMRFGY